MLQASTLNTVSCAARDAGCSESLVRQLVDRGAVDAVKDSVGRRLLTSTGIAQLRAHVANRRPRMTAA
jgi:hypothetical protein